MALSRRNFLAASAAVGTGLTVGELSAQTVKIQGFDQTQTNVDRSSVWEKYTDRKLRVGLVGFGLCKFSTQFGLQNHPNVEIAAVSDLFSDRCAELSKAAGCSKTYPSLEEMVKDDSIEAIFCATDAPSHARHAMLCLEHGKHVAVAVPAFYGDVEEAQKLYDCVKKHSGLVYAMFETSTFHDDLFAMEKLYGAGVFGRLIYSEGEYCHPSILGGPRLGSYKDWRKNGCPMWYPTHASAYYVGVTHGWLNEVTCYGTAAFDEIHRKPNANGNIFRSEVGLFRTSEGGMCRLIVCHSQGEYLEAGRIRGEFGGFNRTFIGDPTAKSRYEKVLADGLQLKKYALPPGVMPGGHGGSHGYLGDDFVDSILRNHRPRVDVVDALNMTIPGWYAHKSAMNDGETLKIPHFEWNLE